MSARVACPLDDCPWADDERSPDVGIGVLAGVFGPGVMAAVSQANYQRDLEDRIERHLKTHSVVEWTRTVMRLRAELSTLRLQCAPSEVRT